MAKYLRAGKGRRSQGKALGGKGGKDLSRERGGKILGRKGRRSGGKGLRGEMISTGKGVEKILGRKGRRSGGKKANRERGERSKEGKGRSSQGVERPDGGKGGKDLNTGKGGNNLRKERGGGGGRS